MRFVPIKDVKQQARACSFVHLFVRRRSQLANSFRAQMSELGIISALGMASIAKLTDKVRDPDVSLLREPRRERHIQRRGGEACFADGVANAQPTTRRLNASSTMAR
jgi:hypothetical protein